MRILDFRLLIGGDVAFSINRVVVIGSGTMGGGIAAHVANAGIPVYLLDVAPDKLTSEEEARGLTLQHPRVRNRIVNAGLERIKKSKPPALFTPSVAELITTGNLEDNFAWVAEGDWIVEAIIEDLDAKRKLVARIDAARKPGSILSSNTSGLPIGEIAAHSSADFKAHFIGTHFFNPPRYMKLLEIIPSRDSRTEVVEFMRRFASERLGKGVVICKDTPNFIANRLGSISGSFALSYVLDHGYTVEEADAILGPLIGRPKTAMFRLMDLVGFDVSASVARNLYGLIPHDESREILQHPKVVSIREQMLERGWIGDKAGQGFYKKVKKGSQTETLSLDLETLEYRARREPDLPSLKQAEAIASLPARLVFLVAQDDRAGQLVRHVIYHNLAYASRRLPEIADDIVSVDRAVRWGFSHELGPFELWDALGVGQTVEAMEMAGIAVAPWVKEMLDGGGESFYRSEKGQLSYYDPGSKAYRTIEADPGLIILKDLKAAGRTIRESAGASLVDLGDGVACLEFHTKMNTLDREVIEMMREALMEVERNFLGLVIGNQATDFSVGANLAKLLQAIEAKAFDQIEQSVRAMQEAMQAIRFSPKPVVAAPCGRTLAGGAEVALAAARMAAAAETYLGLVEVGVGLIPAAGGCKELVRRNVSPAMKTPGVDATPFLRQVSQTIAMAKVSSSAAEARELGFMADTDLIVMNRDRLLAEAKRAALALSDAGYVSPARGASCFAAGRGTAAALKSAVHQMRQGNYLSEYDAKLAGRVAYVICGGDLSAPQWVSEQYLLDLEREAFVSLCGEPKTVERIRHMLSTGQPLRN
jgi:3-hydroxyacyl-CoA dehydrogenase